MSPPADPDRTSRGWHDVLLVARVRRRQGVARVRAAWFPILQASVAAGIAFGIAHYVLGHPYPFFAPVSAWIALGFSTDRSARRVAELAVGVAIGVGLGDAVVHVIGTGLWQVALVLFVAATVSRLLDRGAMLTTQAGVQAIVIVGLPAAAATGGPFGRWTDALVGGAVALAVALLTPSDPRRHPRALGQRAVDEVAAVLHLLARGLRAGSASDVEDALVRGRASQPSLDEWTDVATNARDLARLSPAGRRHHDELALLVAASVQADRAMRNARVLTRRALALLDAPATHDLRAAADRIEATAHAADDLAAEIGTGRDPARARAGLLAAAGALDPFVVAPQDWQVQSLVLLHRSLVVDLLEAAGEDPARARAALPEL
ncbi:FUSC family protein [Cellulomonas gilvus]|uniref:Membrane protein-like protein n=1 Tax=Cellulomonas gilvus (strain ATCC 13127 / NRRL B-14078) TaxID=593907 RepID=F8A577_CELGA|nr:FUSC family protein [Cellulomonas gilvus]AEI13321.1 membrane protein-like protein [Cellulomonas gilvus ATCC 13127]